MDYFVHPQGICESRNIGKNTKIWAFAHILEDVEIGDDCNICDHVFIENGVIIGDRVTIKCGVQLWNGVRIADDVFIGPNATFTNDPFPRSKDFKKPSVTIVERGASIGANATILPGLTIGANAMVGAGAVVAHNVPPNAIVMGPPAVITGYVETSKVSVPVLDTPENRHSKLGIGDSVLSHLNVVPDLRGSLTVGEFTKDIPFSPARYFIVYNVPSKEVRGEHTHKKCEQFLICVSGSVSVVLDDGEKRIEIMLDKPSLGLYIPPMVWSIQYKYSKEAVLLVYASDLYDPDDYIRDYGEFLFLKKNPR